MSSMKFTLQDDIFVRLSPKGQAVLDRYDSFLRGFVPDFRPVRKMYCGRLRFSFENFTQIFGSKFESDFKGLFEGDFEITGMGNSPEAEPLLPRGFIQLTKRACGIGFLFIEHRRIEYVTEYSGHASIHLSRGLSSYEVEESAVEVFRRIEQARHRYMKIR